jgi:hypothetical protein
VHCWRGELLLLADRSPGLGARQGVPLGCRARAGAFVVVRAAFAVQLRKDQYFFRVEQLPRNKY